MSTKRYPIPILKRAATVLLAILLLAPCGNFAQSGGGKPTQPVCTVEVLSDTSAFWARGLEFSSMAFRGDTLVLPSEKCDSIYRFLVRGDKLHYLNAIYVNSRADHAIEGAAIWQDRLYLADEGITDSGTFPLQYYYPLPLSHGDIPIQISHDVPVINVFKDNKGTEGIAVGPGGRMVYLLRENDGAGHAVIYSFVQQNNTRWACQAKDTYTVNNDCRYADIYFDSAQNRLLCLRSCFKGKGYGYAVLGIDVNNNGKLGNNPQNESGISEALDRYLTRLDTNVYSNNVEGIALKDGYLYFITDNRNSSSCADVRTAGNTKRSLFFRIKLTCQPHVSDK